MAGDKPGVTGIPPGGRRIPVDPRNMSKGVVHIECGTALQVCGTPVLLQVCGVLQAAAAGIVLARSA